MALCRNLTISGWKSTVYHTEYEFGRFDDESPCPNLASVTGPPDDGACSRSVSVRDASHRNSVAIHHRPRVLFACPELSNSELFETTLKREGGQIHEDGLKTLVESLYRTFYQTRIVVVAAMFHRRTFTNFYEFSASHIDQLSLSVLRDILSDPSLVLRDEDSLFEIIHRRDGPDGTRDLSYFGLLELVRFEFLSDKCMKTAFDFISNSFDSFTLNIWFSLRTRLTLLVSPSHQTGRYCLPEIDSKIIAAVPELFSIFGGKALRLLYRESRDGFRGPIFIINAMEIGIRSV
jgi:hypothetical protein